MKHHHRLLFIGVGAAFLVAVAVLDVRAAEPPKNSNVAFVEGDGRVAVLINGMPVTVYSYRDEKIPRPYFTHVRTSEGRQVTRNHPPAEGHDLPDHDTFHPGIWLAFGDINGVDFWRNKAEIKHVGFVDRPRSDGDRGSFSVDNAYINPSEPAQVLCHEITRYTVVPSDAGYFLLWDIRFKSDRAFTFGDQEEMGLGFRIATPLRVGDAGIVKVPPGNGTITNSAGAINEKAMWGDAADWCDFSGTVDGRKIGAAILCHPDNLRKSRFHARDYGMLTANPFAQNCFGKGDKLQTTVKPGEELRLRYGIYIHDGPSSQPVDIASAYNQYLQLAH